MPANVTHMLIALKARGVLRNRRHRVAAVKAQTKLLGPTRIFKAASNKDLPKA